MSKQFEEWYLKTFLGYKDPRHLETYKEIELQRWKTTPFSMQWGVYLEFFDSVGKFFIDVKPNIYYIGKYDITFYGGIGEKSILFHEDKKHKSRQEAQQEAIEKAFEILEG